MLCTAGQVENTPQLCEPRLSAGFSVGTGTTLGIVSNSQVITRLAHRFTIRADFHGVGS